MKSIRSSFCNWALACGAVAAALLATDLAGQAAPLTAAEATELGTDALYLWLSTHHDGIHPPRHDQRRDTRGHACADGPAHPFARVPNASFRDITAPNADTLYTTCFLDVGKEPYVLSLPDAHGRYYLFPMLNGWTDVFRVPASAPPARPAHSTPSPARTGKAPCPTA